MMWREEIDKHLQDIEKQHDSAARRSRYTDAQGLYKNQLERLSAAYKAIRGHAKKKPIIANNILFENPHISFTREVRENQY